MKRILNKLLVLPKRTKKLLLLFADILILTTSTILSFYIVYGIDFSNLNLYLIYLVHSNIIACICLNFFGLYKTIIRFSDAADIDNTFKALIGYFMLMSVFIYLNIVEIKIQFLIIQTLFLFLFFLIFRRVLIKILKLNNFNNSLNPILIYGAGSAGRQLLGIIQGSNKEHVIGFIDDDKNLQLRTQNGINIYHPKNIKGLVKVNDNIKVIIAMPSISKPKKNKIITDLLQYNIPISSLPNIDSILAKNEKPTDIVNIKIEDLLGRDSVVPDKNLLSKNIVGKIVLITGAGGSIGSELSRQIYNLRPQKIVLVDNSEYGLFKIFNELLSYKYNEKNITDIIPIMCDINDKNGIDKVFINYKPFSVFHTAAYKHVHLVEMNNLVGVKNNVLGTLNVIQTSLYHNVKNFIFISTDKAVRPTNLMGATKRFSELILQSLAKENKKIKISIVRFGNVLDSSGSVIPIFRQQIKNGGPVTVSHKNVERYFMTIPEAAELVIQSSSISQKHGSIFYLDMGKPIKIVDLAKRMINLSGHSISYSNKISDHYMEIVFTGLKRGEKMFEELVIDGVSQVTENPKIYSVEESFVEWKFLKHSLITLEEDIKNFNIEKVKNTLENYVTGYKK